MPHNTMDDELPLTIDQLMQRRLILTGDEPIIAYPDSGINYIDYSTRELDGFAYNAARHYAARMPQRAASEQKPRVVGLLGPSNLTYVVSMLALTKLGHTVLYLSPRISKDAHVSLLQKTECRDLIVGQQFRPMSELVKDDLPDLQVHDFAGKNLYSTSLPPKQDTKMDQALDPKQENKYVAWIIHSSGSTSLPKPVYLTHRAVINNYSAHNPVLKAYITVPLYHSHGVGSLLKTFYCGKQAHLVNCDLPLSTKYLVGTMKKHKFEIVHAVPYALKLLAESDEGIDLLAQTQMVMYGGSACPDALGDMLTECGVFLVSHYGTTETGMLMSSERLPEDKLWNWVRPTKMTKPHLTFDDQGHGLFELICGANWPGKVMSNLPDGSYATRDLFTKHPTIEAYKYYSRLDDTINLVNGEKANPLGIEGAIRQQPGVREVVAFGHGKDRLGLFIIPSQDISSDQRGTFLHGLWPTLEQAQSDMPAYARLSRDMVTILPSNFECPTTDKRTIIRQLFYRKLEKEIEAAYESATNEKGNLDLSLDELKAFIRKEVLAITGTEVGSVNNITDFFQLGMDSLQATQLRSSLARTVNMHGNQLGLNVVFDYPNVELLAQKLHSFQPGATVTTEETTEEEMQRFLTKYGTFAGPPLQGALPSDSHHVLLTGTSGSLGAHILAMMLADKNVERVYCPVRATSDASALERVVQSLRTRMVLDDLSTTSLAKMQVLASDLSQPDLGLDPTVLQQITSNLTSVVHCAWSVNFNLRLQSFEDVISGTRNLIDLCTRSAEGGRTPASFNFCSSVSTAEDTTDADILEALPPNFTYARPTGYAQSKLVCEHICDQAAKQAGVTSRVLRVGQLVGDTKYGVWNANEAFPLIWQSARTIGALPQITDSPRWLAVDVAARTIADLSLSVDAPSDVYNVTNHSTFNWTNDLLPKLKASRGLGEYIEVKPREWVQRLRDSLADPTANPPYKLLEFFAGRYGEDKEAQAPKNWHTDKAQKYSAALRNASVIDQGLVDRVISRFNAGIWGANEKK